MNSTTALNIIVVVCVISILITIVFFIVDHIRIRYGKKRSLASQIIDDIDQSHTFTPVCQPTQPSILSIKQTLDQYCIANDHLKWSLIVALLSQGHCMIRGNPGTGKTHLTTVFATLIGCPYSRIQGTSDLMPADIIGSQIYNRETQNFLYRRGPLYNHIVIVDELNRIPPKTQSAFLQAMQEKSLTLDQQTVLLEKPFMLIATINHNDLIGTYGLPQSLLDRFMIQSESQTLDHEGELQMLNIPGVDTLQSLRTVDMIRGFQNQIEDIGVDQTLQKVMIEHIAQLRMIYPFSSRAVEHLYKMSKTWARCCGETKVSLHHIRDMSSLLMTGSKK